MTVVPPAVIERMRADLLDTYRRDELIASRGEMETLTEMIQTLRQAFWMLSHLRFWEQIEVWVHARVTWEEEGSPW